MCEGKLQLKETSRKGRLTWPNRWQKALIPTAVRLRGVGKRAGGYVKGEHGCAAWGEMLKLDDFEVYQNCSWCEAFKPHWY